MKITTRLLFTLIILLCLMKANAQGFLKASNKQIVNEKNENVLLKGIGLGGWMLQEGYMLKLQGANPQYAIKKRIDSLIGVAKTQEFYDVWLNNFITKADIDSMHVWGFNSVRLPMHYNLYTLPVGEEKDLSKQTWLTKGFALTDSLLKWCKANNMYLILDLHAAPGGQGNDLNIADRDSTKPSLWQSETNKTKTIELWHKLAERYKDEPNIGAYDILNEPNWGFDDTINDKHGQKETSNKPLKELLVNITNAIRSVDKKHIIIIEGNAWGNNYKGMLPTWDNNMVLSFHKYWNFNDQQSIQHILDYRNKYNVPVWLGETGENSNTWFTDAVQLFEKNNIGWSWWPLKKLGNNNALQIRANNNYQNLADYWNGQSAKPTENDAYNGLIGFAKATNIHSNIIHYDVIDALMRQPSTNATKPFKPNIINVKDSVIDAVDYDLGRNNIAYFDKDTGNYYISTGGRNAGNKGYTYRNDGIDIYKDSSGNESYYVGSIEDSEWMQYTINITEASAYNFKLNIAAENNAQVTISVDGKPSFMKKELLPTGSLKSFQTQTLGTIQLNKGKHIIKFYADKGGFNCKTLMLVKQ